MSKNLTDPNRRPQYGIPATKLGERCEFLSMGRRRPAVIGAQLGLSLALLALTFVERPTEQVGLLMLIGMFINNFAATRGVAVNGMSTDLTAVRM